jgi:hypothetical protein
MNEYKVVYWEDNSGESAFGATVKSKFQKEINELAQDGWIVKFSNVAILNQGNGEKALMSAYALLEREVIPAPFRGRSKDNNSI